MDGARELQRTTIAAIFGRYTKPPTSFGTEEKAMVTEKVDGLAWLHKQVEAADKDFLPGMVETLMRAEVDAVCGAPEALGRAAHPRGMFASSTDARVFGSVWPL